MTPRMYDIHTDESRDVTQDDIDELMIAQQAYGRLRQAVTDTHEWVRGEIAALRERKRTVGVAEVLVGGEAESAEG